jgi:hypothetical protein
MKQEYPKSNGDIVSDYAIAQSKAIQKCMQLYAEMAYKSMPKQETLPKNRWKYVGKQETLESNKTTAIRFLEWYRRKGVIYQFQAYHIQGSDETIYLNADQLFEIFKKELYEK